MPSATPPAEPCLRVRGARSGLAAFVAFSAAVTALGCGGADTEAASPSGGAHAQENDSRKAEPQATRAAEGARERRAQLAIDDALGRVSRVRQLSALGPVNGEVLTPEELVAHVQRVLDKEVPPHALGGTAEILWALGTVPDGFDYRGSVLSMMSDELAGLYDPDAKTMFLRGDLGKEAEDATLLHELVHALQDQHYKLDRMTEWRDDATDELSAFSCLAEGDATSAMLDGMLDGSGKTALDLPTALLEGQMRMLGGITEDAQRVPSILKRSLLAPYVDGLSFVHSLRRSGGWRAVDDAFRAAPTTTEQVLHPEKYAAREPAISVGVPAPPPGGAGAESNGFSLYFRDVWGEQSTRLVFEEWMPLRSAAESASGWGGDRIALYRDGDLGAVAWHLLADDDAAATRMLHAFTRGVLSKTWSSSDASSLSRPSESEARAASQGQKACRERKSRGPMLVKKRGRALVVVLGPYSRSSPGRVVARCSDAERWADLVLGAKP